MILEQRRDRAAGRRMRHAERRDGDDERERDEDQQAPPHVPREVLTTTADDVRYRSRLGQRLRYLVLDDISHRGLPLERCYFATRSFNQTWL